MNNVCLYCKAERFEKEPNGICCLNGEIMTLKIQPLKNPPEPLKSLMSGIGSRSIHFFQNIRKYNTAFQMTSFGVKVKFNDTEYMPTFKVQGKIYHLMGTAILFAPISRARV